MSTLIPKGKMTAYQRWELAAFDEEEKRAAQDALEAEKQEALAEAIEPQLEEAGFEAVAVEEASLDEIPAEPITLPTLEDIERIHNEAHEQGYNAGFEEGLANAQEIAARMTTLMSHLEHDLATVDQTLANQILATAVEIARQMARQSFDVNPEFLLPVVREAMKTVVPSNTPPLLYLHPEDAALVRKNFADQIEHQNWKIIEDNSLTMGGCRVEIGASNVDATYETRWQRVLESIGINQDWLEKNG